MLSLIQGKDQEAMKIRPKRISCFPYEPFDNFVTAEPWFSGFEKGRLVMKAIAFAVIVVLTLAPGVLAEETFNPSAGEWEEDSDADEVLQDPYGAQPLYKDPDIETPYDPYRDQQGQQQPQDETWSDGPEDQWDKPQAEDDLSDSDDDEWNQPPPEEGYSDGYEDQGSQEQSQEESWSYSPGTGERRGPPPFLKVPSNRR